ncbi:dihydrolipoyl dehydrogenase [Arsenicicoccus piscis]|uniref:Dihydrolipoyl dehydrogenase n=1 Tax=Arsenicicoccus piscis TaxID=673954 RepID=A0ABQ6HN93_9MICO|nr:dihydrolipoyl dehydrogenase [Arsenicicoccus piscis]MCH8628494.1 dihydrolipoyl dehydrogenase [Arsenicicoccus piscis]GMA19933.1 dihydrolipoyl dehydrogenase [Arsenicicoccus piscis]
MTDTTYDIVVLGAGSAGYACALRARQLGLTVALVERDKVGGTCLHRGCIPTKAFLHAAEIADGAKESERFGVKATFDAVDVPALQRYKSGVVDRLYKGLQGLVRGAGVDVINGDGRVVGSGDGTHTVEVRTSGEGRAATRQVTGRHLVLATGSAPRTLPGLEIGGRIVTSDQLLEMDTVPARTIVLGGGVIGVELASALTSFGSEVTIVEALPRLVAAEDEAISKALQRAFTKRGITVRTGVALSGATQSDEQVQVELADGSTLDADVLLVAVGRGPVSADLGYEQLGLTLERGLVSVDDHCRTGVPGVFAVGDLVPGPQLAHRGFAHGILVAETIAGLDPAPVDDLGLPKVTYCDPEIASVGYTEAAAREAFGDVEVYDYNLAGNGRSQILGTTGFVKVVRRTDGPVVGVHMVGARMGEQVGEAALLYHWEAWPDEVAPLLHAHPTQNEALGEAALALAGKPLHAHP